MAPTFNRDATRFVYGVRNLDEVEMPWLAIESKADEYHVVLKKTWEPFSYLPFWAEMRGDYALQTMLGFWRAKRLHTEFKSEPINKKELPFLMVVHLPDPQPKVYRHYEWSELKEHVSVFIAERLQTMRLGLLDGDDGMVSFNVNNLNLGLACIKEALADLHLLRGSQIGWWDDVKSISPRLHPKGPGIISML